MKIWIKKKIVKIKEVITNFISKIKNINFKSMDTKSLSFKLWTYFSMFAIFIFILLWFMQVIFLQSYYTKMKKNEVIKLSEKIYAEYKKDDFINSIDEISYKNSLNVFLIDSDGNTLYNSYLQDNNDSKMQRPNIVINTSEIIKQIMSSKNGKISYTTQITKFKSQLFIYGTKLDNSTYLIMTAYIDPIDSTTSVLKEQLKDITIISLIFSFIVSFFISRKIAKPIINMEKSANSLKNGDYNVVFEKGDYTEIDNLATTLNATTTELAKTDKLRKELIANVSHDLRTPLTMIKAYAEMIQDISGDNKEKREEHLKVIIDETDRLTRLITDMMDLSKLESGILTIKKEEFNLTDTINMLLRSFRNMYEKEGYNFKFDCNEDIYVIADEIKIEQVLYNLISNAVNYSDDNKNIEINISKDKNNARIEVIDNGRGISKEKLPYIWDRYYKVGEIHKTSKTGTGLGLSIVKNILEKHGKKYGVESEVNKGSKFWFEVDLSKNNKKLKE